MVDPITLRRERVAHGPPALTASAAILIGVIPRYGWAGPPSPMIDVPVFTRSSSRPCTPQPAITTTPGALYTRSGRSLGPARTTSLGRGQTEALRQYGS